MKPVWIERIDAATKWRAGRARPTAWLSKSRPWQRQPSFWPCSHISTASMGSLRKEPPTSRTLSCWTVCRVPASGWPRRWSPSLRLRLQTKQGAGRRCAACPGWRRWRTRVENAGAFASASMQQALARRAASICTLFDSLLRLGQSLLRHAPRTGRQPRRCPAQTRRQMLKIIHRMIETGETYDDARYVQALRKSGSPISRKTLWKNLWITLEKTLDLPHKMSERVAVRKRRNAFQRCAAGVGLRHADQGRRPAPRCSTGRQPWASLHNPVGVKAKRYEPGTWVTDNTGHIGNTFWHVFTRRIPRCPGRRPIPCSSGQHSSRHALKAKSPCHRCAEGMESAGRQATNGWNGTRGRGIRGFWSTAGHHTSTRT